MESGLMIIENHYIFEEIIRMMITVKSYTSYYLWMLRFLSVSKVNLYIGDMYDHWSYNLYHYFVSNHFSNVKFVSLMKGKFWSHKILNIRKGL